MGPRLVENWTVLGPENDDPGWSQEMERKMKVTWSTKGYLRNIRIVYKGSRWMFQVLQLFLG